jgi:DNA-3-methyladenine glycosylase
VRPAFLQDATLWTPDALAGETLAIAPALLGSYLVRELDGQWLVGRIVETEAYLSEGDPACHAYKRETPRNRVMFGDPGMAYVYKIYGLYHCVNVVTEAKGRGAAVLIRALEPIAGLEAMADRRNGSRDLTNGPGRLCLALGIDTALNGVDLTRPGPLYLLRPPAPPDEVVATSPRIGITQGAEFPWRYFYRGNRWVSKGPMAKIQPPGP